jgi:predicted RNA binding protein YcfA (HicA-like mRNA interferase family)
VRLPRDCSADTLVKALVSFGYVPTRQTGSHIGVTTSIQGEHHVTIPNHRPMRVGTLHAILKDVAEHHQTTVEDLVVTLRL